MLALAGVGVNDGGFSGDSGSDVDFDTALRFLGRGVAGRNEAGFTESELSAPLVVLSLLVASGNVLAGAFVVLRFFAGTLALLTCNTVLGFDIQWYWRDITCNAS